MPRTGHAMHAALVATFSEREGPKLLLCTTAHPAAAAKAWYATQEADAMYYSGVAASKEFAPLVRNLCVRALSAESVGPDREGKVVFGQEGRSYSMAHIFHVFDSEARGMQRTFALIYTQPDCEAVVGNATYTTGVLRDIAHEVHTASKKVFCMENRRRVRQVGSADHHDAAAASHPWGAGHGGGRRELRTLPELLGNPRVMAMLHTRLSGMLHVTATRGAMSAPSPVFPKHAFDSLGEHERVKAAIRHAEAAATALHEQHAQPHGAAAVPVGCANTSLVDVDVAGTEAPSTAPQGLAMHATPPVGARSEPVLVERVLSERSGSSALGVTPASDGVVGTTPAARSSFVESVAAVTLPCGTPTLCTQELMPQVVSPAQSYSDTQSNASLMRRRGGERGAGVAAGEGSPGGGSCEDTAATHITLHDIRAALHRGPAKARTSTSSTRDGDAANGETAHQPAGQDAFALLVFHLVAGDQVVVTSESLVTTAAVVRALSALLPKTVLKCAPYSNAYAPGYVHNLLGLSRELFANEVGPDLPDGCVHLALAGCVKGKPQTGVLTRNSSVARLLRLRRGEAAYPVEVDQLAAANSPSEPHQVRRLQLKYWRIALLFNSYAMSTRHSRAFDLTPAQLRKALTLVSVSSAQPAADAAIFRFLGTKPRVPATAEAAAATGTTAAPPPPPEQPLPRRTIVFQCPQVD